MIIAKWHINGLYKADAQKVADEILTIGETANPKQILDKARDERTELHKCFTWDDGIAAEKWRLQEARQIVCNIVFERAEPETAPVRVFHKINSNDGYKSIEKIIVDKTEYKELLKQAKSDLMSFQRKYKGLAELEEVFTAIDRLNI